METILSPMTHLKYDWSSIKQLPQYGSWECREHKFNQVFEETFKEYAQVEQVGSTCAGSTSYFYPCGESFESWRADHKAPPSTMTNGTLTELFSLRHNESMMVLVIHVQISYLETVFLHAIHNWFHIDFNTIDSTIDIDFRNFHQSRLDLTCDFTHRHLHVTPMTWDSKDKDFTLDSTFENCDFSPALLGQGPAEKIFHILQYCTSINTSVDLKLFRHMVPCWLMLFAQHVKYILGNI